MKTLTLFIVLALFIQTTGSSQPCLPEGITFTTQEQIDNFQTNYPNCTEIEGDVMIDDIWNSPISNLNGLNVVTSIGGYLKVQFNNTMTSLTGLDNTTSIGGDFVIQYTDALTSLTGLDNVTSIGGFLDINHNDALTSITGLDNLTSIGTWLSIHDNDSLSICETLWLCDFLANPTGSVKIFGNASGCNNPLEVADSCGITLPCLPFGNYYFFTQDEIDNFSTNYPNCTEIEGDVEISGNDITNLEGLSVMTSIGGDLYIYSTTALSHLTGLDNVTSIEGNLKIGRTFIFGGNLSLISLTGLENVISIGGSLIIIANNALTNLSGLGSLTSIEGNLSIGIMGPVSGGVTGNAALTSLTGLDNLTFIGGGIKIAGNPTLTSLTGLDNVTSNVGYLGIYANNSLKSLSGLGNLTSIEGNLSIGYDNQEWGLYGNHSLEKLTGLDNVTSIWGDIDIIDSDALTNFAELENVSSIGGYLRIYENNILTSLTGLENIDAASISSLSIHYNPFLSTCEVQSICDYLASPNGEIEIHDNALGCNSQEEVEAACWTSVEDINEVKDCSIYPNPVKDIATFSSAAITSIEIYDMMGSLIIKQENNKVDMSSLPSGIYFVIGFDKYNNDLYKGKIIKK